MGLDLPVVCGSCPAHQRENSEHKRNQKKNPPGWGELQQHRPEKCAGRPAHLPETRLALQGVPVHFMVIKAIAVARLREELRPQNAYLNPFADALPEVPETSAHSDG